MKLDELKSYLLSDELKLFMLAYLGDTPGVTSCMYPIKIINIDWDDHNINGYPRIIFKTYEPDPDPSHFPSQVLSKESYSLYCTGYDYSDYDLSTFRIEG